MIESNFPLTGIRRPWRDPSIQIRSIRAGNPCLSTLPTTQSVRKVTPGRRSPVFTPSCLASSWLQVRLFFSSYPAERHSRSAFTRAPNEPDRQGSSQLTRPKYSVVSLEKPARKTRIRTHTHGAVSCLLLPGWSILLLTHRLPMEFMTASLRQEPTRIVRRGRVEFTLLGTAHISRASTEEVIRQLDQGQYDAVAVELCPSRHAALTSPDLWGQTDLFRLIREGKAGMLAASLALGGYQRRLAEQFGVEPGAEMRAAVERALVHHIPVLLVDRDIGTTLKRTYRSVSRAQRFTILGGLLASVVSREKVSEEEVERLKEGDILETTFAEFTGRASSLQGPLIDERDRFMAARLCEETGDAGYRRVLVVVGAGHLKGLAHYLSRGEGCDDPRATVARLEALPPRARWPRVLPWAVVAIILTGFAIGFARSPELGALLVWEWILLNGALSAIGAIIAGAHPLTVIAAFVAAPWTSLNPMIGASMVAGAVEVWLRKPRVADFGTLRSDVTSLRGWWRNRVSRTLLVFFLAGFGSSLGTYLAGFRIYDHLLGT